MLQNVGLRKNIWNQETGSNGRLERETCNEEANSRNMRTDEMGRTCTKKGANKYKMFVRNSAGYRPFWRSRRIKQDATLRKTGREGADSILSGSR